MTLIVHKGRVEHTAGTDTLTTYAVDHRTKVVSVTVWGFERLPYGQITVRWANGAQGSHVGPDYRAFMDMAEHTEGWPEPRLFPRSLPHAAGMHWTEELEPQINKEPESEEVTHAVKRVVRQRHVGSDSDNGPSVRRRRVRSEN